MSAVNGGSHSGGENEDIEADEATRNEHGRATGEEESLQDDELHEELQEELQRHDAVVSDAPLPEDEAKEANGLADGEGMLDEDYPQIKPSEPDDLEEGGLDSEPVTPLAKSRLGSPADSGSVPDDTPSRHGSLLASPDRVASPTPRTNVGRKISGALQPFERRFEARPSVSRSPSSRAESPAFLGPNSRRISLTSQFSQISSQEGSGETETPQAPWDVMKWTKLRRITTQAFSEAGRRNFGRPTCLAVSALIAIGTSKGLILGFDYHQTLKIIIGQGTKATECGSVTALAIAADYTTIASGHANGHIFTWEINRPSQPFLRIPPIDRSALQQSQHPDGHVANTAILHVGFLGTRRTALVSADAAGMAFSHLATRGLGPVTRTIASTRLLGRYPPFDPSTERSRKPSSVLAFSPLPLGNVEQSTDNMGLTALLTPYLLVIVSTTPSAQTQYKAPRPKEISTHGTLSGCLAWFPAVKLKRANAGPTSTSSKTKLVYCWSNVLTVLDVTIVDDGEPADANKPPSLEFHPRKRWRAEEAIVAVQWLGRSVLGVLTISQRLLIVEDGSLQITDSLDLLQRHIYHQDLFSEQLQSVVEHMNSAEPSLHGVVADAFYMSFRVYKGRTFLLGFSDLTVGTLSNWADRLMALMEAGDQVAAIRLATDYYVGSANNVTVGLPDADEARHNMVKERLLAMISASLSYTFSQEDDGRAGRLRELAAICFDACISMLETEYLLSVVYDIFEDADEESIFVSTLEPYILDDAIKVLPPEVVKSLTSYFISQNEAARLEELLCRLDPRSYDLEQITMLARQHRLYDALIYVWTQAIGDYVTPLIDLLQLVQMLEDMSEDEQSMENPYYESATKVFSYLAYALTGRRYPSGELMDDAEALHAMTNLYEYLFSGRPMAWPSGGDQIFHTVADPQDEPAFPYLVLLLQFDTNSFMSMLNEAFEHSFLNNADDELISNGSTRVNGISSLPRYQMTRDRIISITREVMKQNGFSRTQTIFLYMFIARSLPKYPNQIVLQGSFLNMIVQELCNPPSEALREDCQLSAEYLLSAYHPTDVSQLIESLRAAQFFRVLKSVYRKSRMYAELLNVYFEDPNDRIGVFDCIAFCLKASSGLNQKQLQGIKVIISQHIDDLIAVSTVLTARTLATYAPDMLLPSIDALDDSYTQFTFIRSLLEPSLLHDYGRSQFAPLPAESQAPFLEEYVRLTCKHDPMHVSDYVGLLPTSSLRLQEVLPAMEQSGVTDAAVALLARNGLAKDGMDRLVAHLGWLQRALTDMINAAHDAPDSQATGEAAQHLVEDIEKYSKVGIWLCQGETANAQRQRRPRTNLAWEIKESDLELDELLWLDLIDSVVQISKTTGQAVKYLEEHPVEADQNTFEPEKILSSLRSNAQQTFTALLAATATSKSTSATESPEHPSRNDHLSFLRVFRAFLSRASITAPALSDLRTVLSDIFSAYTFEEGVLSLGNELLGSDVFAEIDEANRLRQRGWRPRAQVCEHCKRRAWGPGIGGIVWDEWISREQEREADKSRRLIERGGGEDGKRLERGKAKAKETAPSTRNELHDDEEVRRLTLVVFSCRHAFHRVCLDAAFRDGKPLGPSSYKCPLCTGDT